MIAGNTLATISPDTEEVIGHIPLNIQLEVYIGRLFLYFSDSKQWGKYREKSVLLKVSLFELSTKLSTLASHVHNFFELREHQDLTTIIFEIPHSVLNQLRRTAAPIWIQELPQVDWLDD